jgi:hypothetical protein
LLAHEPLSHEHCRIEDVYVMGNDRILAFGRIHSVKWMDVWILKHEYHQHITVES